LAGRLDRTSNLVDREAGHPGGEPAAALAHVGSGLIRPLSTAAVSVALGVTVNVGRTAVGIRWRIWAIVIGESGAVRRKREAVGVGPERTGENVPQKKRPEHRPDPAPPTAPAAPSGSADMGKTIPFVPVAERVAVEALSTTELVFARKPVAFT